MRSLLMLTTWMLFMLVLSACQPISPVAQHAAPAEPTVTITEIPLLAPPDCSGAFIAHDLDHLTNTDDGVIRMFEANGSGAAAGDLDNDGDLDLVLGNLDAPNTILWNEGNLRFRSERLGEPNTRSLTIVDVDADGWLDIVLTRNTGVINYWRNQANGAFQRITLPGVSQPAYVLNWGDLDGDGDLDLVTASYDAGLLTDRGNEYLLAGGGGVTVYDNDGGRFRPTRLANEAQALALLLFDVDGNGRLDILVGNDFDLPDMAWLNTANGWQPAAPFANTTHSTMSLDAGDVHNDGHQEIFASDMKPYLNDAQTAMAYAPFMAGAPMDHMMDDPQVMENVLLVRDDLDKYFNVSDATGVDASGWSWTGRFGDLDSDGFLDLYIVNGFAEETLVGHLPNHELVEENQVFRNDGAGRFEPMTQWGLASTRSGRSMLMADLDDDGDLEIVANNLRSAAQLFENDLCGGDDLLVELSLPGSQNRNALGAVVQLQTDLGVLTRGVRAASGYLSGEPARVHFGLPAGATIASMTIRWPDSETTILPAPPINHLLRIARPMRLLMS
jgi:hypothetical protein